MRALNAALPAALVLAAWVGVCGAQPIERQRQIDEIAATARAAGLPHLLGEVLPMTLRYAVREELIKVGREESLGRNWRPRNPWFERAAVLADQASVELAQRIEAHPRDWEPAFRAALVSVPDRDFPGLLQLYRSPAAAQLTELADLTVGLFVLASLQTQRRSVGMRAAALPAMARLSDRISEIILRGSRGERDAFVVSATPPALKTLARVHDEFFRNYLRALQPEISAAREQARRALAPLIERYDPLEPAPADDL